MICCVNLKGASGIYCAIHRETGQCYVGSSLNIWKRRSEHLSYARRGSMNRFHIAIRKYGAGAFDLELLEVCSKENMLGRERFYIAMMGAAGIDGLNTRENPTANYDFRPTAATCARISASKKGIPRTLAQSLAQSIGQTGLKRSAESCMRISLALAGKRKSIQHRKALSLSKIGTKRSEEAKAKTSASLIGRVFSAESIAKQKATVAKKMAEFGPAYRDNRKPIIATDSVGRLLHVWDSLMECVDGLKTPNSSIRYYLRTGKITPKGMLLYYATIAQIPEPPELSANIPVQE